MAGNDLGGKISGVAIKVQRSVISEPSARDQQRQVGGVEEELPQKDLQVILLSYSVQ